MKSNARLIFPIAILALGLLGAVTIYATRPAVETRAPDRPAPLVRVVEVTPSTVELEVATQGTVEPRTESDLVPEVSGPVVWISPSLVSGGFFEQDEALLRVDAMDYDVALERARANLARSQSQHAQAKRELERQRGLARREVASAAQLDLAVNAEQVARATLREARASLSKAERDLERTEIRAPFAGRVRTEQVDVGQFINRGVRVATVYAIDYAEVRLPIPDDELRFLELPLWYRGEIPQDEGPEVELHARFAGAEHSWTGRVVRTEGEIDSRSRMVHVVARVEDPYGQIEGSTRPPLAVGLFVEARIKGRTVEDVVRAPRAALRGEDRLLVVDGENRLRFRDIELLRAGYRSVLVRSGLEDGDRVILSPLDAAVDGMLVLPSVVPDEDAFGDGS
jgi:RND family efflux transporter MFP subunit